MLGVITALGKDLADFYKVKHPPTFYPTIPWCLSKRNENMSRKDLFKSAHRNFIHNSPKLETVHMSTSRGTDK